MSGPLLTIAIPTYNRAPWLRKNLERLHAEWRGVDAAQIEILVCDNASPDETAEVVRQAQAQGLPVVAHRRAHNIGSDANIAGAFHLARGKYVLLLGDDDLLTPGALAWLLARLQERDRGVLCLRAFGYDHDPDAEAPQVARADRDGLDAARFLVEAGALITFISSCVINKQALGDLDARAFVGTHLVQVELVLRAALAEPCNLVTQSYRIACKRNNSGGYDVFDVFVDRLGRILDSHVGSGLSASAAAAFGDVLLIGFYPQILLQARWRGQDLSQAGERLRARYGGRRAYRVFVAPVLDLPRPLALLWGAMAVAVGRAWRGDLLRGLAFVKSRLRRR